MYYFKHKDTILADVVFTDIGFKILEVYMESSVLTMLRSDESFNRWVNERRTPIGRENSVNLIRAAGIFSIKSFVDYTLCLSVIDCFWLTKDNYIRWDSVSLYKNPFNKVYTNIAKGLSIDNKTVGTPSPELTIGGSSLKWLKKYSNNIFLYKSFGGMNELESSGSYAEYFSSQLCRYLGFDCVSYDIVKIGGILCSRCMLFTNENIHLIHVSELSDDYRHLEEHILHYKGEARKRFCDLMVLDCLLFNVDRHDENIAILYDDDFMFLGLSSYYDFDHSLFYDLSLVNRTKDYITDKLVTYEPKTYINHSFLDQFRYCIYPELYDKLLNVFKFFSFRTHPEYPILDDRLDMINKVFKWNLKRLLNSVRG